MVFENETLKEFLKDQDISDTEELQELHNNMMKEVMEPSMMENQPITMIMESMYTVGSMKKQSKSQREEESKVSFR